MYICGTGKGEMSFNQQRFRYELLCDWSTWEERLCLTRCGLTPPYGNINLGQNWLRLWLVAWRNQPITWTNVDFLFVGVLWRTPQTISHPIPKLLFCSTILTYILLKSLSHLPGANKLIQHLVIRYMLSTTWPMVAWTEMVWIWNDI